MTESTEELTPETVEELFWKYDEMGEIDAAESFDDHLDEIDRLYTVAKLAPAGYHVVRYDD